MLFFLMLRYVVWFGGLEMKEPLLDDSLLVYEIIKNYYMGYTDHRNHMLYFQSLAAGPGKCMPTVKYSGVTELSDLPKVLEKVWTMRELTNMQIKF